MEKITRQVFYKLKFLIASEEDRQEFIQCGAGPLLEQVLEYMD